MVEARKGSKKRKHQDEEEKKTKWVDKRKNKGEDAEAELGQASA